MLRASVLIPTHEHAATLPLSVASVQAQAGDDVEILIVGDGVNDELRRVVGRLQASDPRIQFFDFPKGPRNGEIHRHKVLQQARGRIICYQSDDDLWLPGHLDALEAGLEEADFCGGMHTDVSADGTVRGYFFDLDRPEFRIPYLRWEHNRLGPWANDGIGLSFVGHRLDAYQRLVEGWGTTPTGLPTDQFMWMKLLRQDWCRAKVLMYPIALHFPAPDRRGWTDQQRVDELTGWAKIIASPGGVELVYRGALKTLFEVLLANSLADAAALAGERQMRAAVEARHDALVSARDRLIADHETERTALQNALATLTAERDALLNSTSWRVTRPLRAAIDAGRRLRTRPRP